MSPYTVIYNTVVVMCALKSERKGKWNEGEKREGGRDGGRKEGWREEGGGRTG